MFIDRGKSLVHTSGYSFLMQEFLEHFHSRRIPQSWKVPLQWRHPEVVSIYEHLQCLCDSSRSHRSRDAFRGECAMAHLSAFSSCPNTCVLGTQEFIVDPINKWPGNISQKPFKAHPVVSRRNSQHSQTLQNVVGPPWKRKKEHPANQWMEEHPQHLSTYDQRSHFPYSLQRFFNKNCRTCLRLVVPDLSVTSDLG